MRLPRRDLFRFWFQGAAACLVPWNAIRGDDSLPPVAIRQRAFPGRLFRYLDSYCDKGFLVATDSLERYEGPLPNVSVYRMDGTAALEMKFMLPGSKVTELLDATVAQSGAVAVCGSSVGSKGELARFVAVLAPSGELTQVIRTNPFQANRVCFGPDESIWALGWSLSDGGPTQGMFVESDMLEHYDRQGRRIGTAAPISACPVKTGNIVWDGSFLRASGGRVGAWIASGQERTEDPEEWIEVSSKDGAILERRPCRRPAPGDILVGLAFTPGGDVYSTFFGSGDGAALHQLDRETWSWRPAAGYSVSRGKAELGRLLGAEAGQLVFQGVNQNVAWRRMPETPGDTR